jgi:phospholipid N-methyltransferase
MRLLSHLIRAPALTGAIVPSSLFLAEAMADAAAGAAHVVELGAGTGPVTRVLSRRYPGSRLTIVELQPELAGSLSRAYPRATVHARPAAEVLDELPADSAPAVLVSSLPFRSLPAMVRQQTRESILRFLRRGRHRWLVQFTYQPRAPFDAEPGFHWRHEKTVVANLPPAGVWTLTRPRH